MKVATRMAFLLTLPVAGMLAFAGLSALSYASVMRDAGAARSHTMLAVAASDLIHELQTERGMSAGYLGSKGAQFGAELPSQRALTDAAMAAVAEAVAADEAGLEEIRSTIDKASAGLARIEGTRKSVDALSMVASDSFAVYGKAIAAYLDVVSRIAALADEPDIVRGAVAYFSFLNLKEQAGQERATLNEVLGSGAFTDATYKRFISIVAAQAEYQSLFVRFAEASDVEALNRNLSTESALRAEQIRLVALSERSDFGVGATEWFEVMSRKITSMKEVENHIAHGLIAVADGLVSRSRRDLILSLSAMGGLVAATLLVGALLFASITRPLHAAVSALRDIAQGAGDLTKRLDERAAGEIGLLSRYFNETMAKIGALVSAIKAEATSMMAVGESLASNMSETAAAVNQISANIASVNAQAINQSAGVTETRATVVEIVKNIEALDKGIEGQSDDVARSAAAVDEMVGSVGSVSEMLARNGRTVDELKDASERGAERMDEVSAIVKTIAQESAGLSEASSVIKKISSQTNLLAMNAAIEAAHAGEYGKGFAVVADEIRSLSEGSSAEAGSISKALGGLQALIDRVERSALDAQERFRRVYELTAAVKGQEAAMRDAMEGQNQSGETVLGAMRRIEEVTARVRDGSGAMLAGSREILAEMERLARVTQEISDGMREMAIGTKEIDGAVSEVNDIGIKNRDSIARLSDEVGRFTV